MVAIATEREMTWFIFYSVSNIKNILECFRSDWADVSHSAYGTWSKHFFLFLFLGEEKSRKLGPERWIDGQEVIFLSFDNESDPQWNRSDFKIQNASLLSVLFVFVENCFEFRLVCEWREVRVWKECLVTRICTYTWAYLSTAYYDLH